MPSAPPFSNESHIQRLDVLRAVAIIFVILFHFNILLSDVVVTGDYKLWSTWLGFGSSGVPLFFVISGFCIQLSYLRNQSQSVKGFYWRRFSRIYPAYFVSLVFFSLLGVFKLRGTINLKQFLLHFLLIHNFFPAVNFYAINSAYWSLAVEFQFYLLFPFLLLLRTRFGLRSCLAATLLLTLLYEIACLQYPAIWRTVSNPTIVPDWYGWILGACVAEQYVRGKRFFPAGRWLIIPLFVLMVCTYLYTHILALHYLTQYFFFALVLELYLTWKGALCWWERILVPVGIVSYSLYLWHYPLLEITHHFLTHMLSSALAASQMFQLLVCLPMSLVVLAPFVCLSYYLCEKYAQRRFRAWRPDA